MSRIFGKSLFIFTLLVSGCSTIIHGTTDTVTFNSTEEGTVLYLNGIPRGKDAATLQLVRGEDYVVRASKKGCKDTVSPVSNTFDATSLLGILIDFGLISIPVDLISGAAWKFNPKMYTVTPICESSVG
jgi:hypothetical protein